MTFETREFLITQERGGKPPDYLMFLEETHTSKKTKEIVDQKAREVIKNVKKRRLDLLTQEEGSLTQELSRDQMNHLVIDVILFKEHDFSISFESCFSLFYIAIKLNNISLKTNSSLKI